MILDHALAYTIYSVFAKAQNIMIFYMIFLSGKIGTFEASLVNAIFFYIGIVILEVPTGYIADIYGKKISMVLSMLSLCIGTLIFAFASNFWQFGLGEFCLALGGALSSGATESWLVEKVGVKKSDTIFGKINMKLASFSFGYSVLGGILYTLWGGEISSLIIASIFAIGTIFTIFGMEKDTIYNHELSGLELLKSANNQIWATILSKKQFLAQVFLMGIICGPVFSFYQLGYQDLKLDILYLGLITACLFMFVGQGYALRNQKWFAKLPKFTRINAFKILLGIGFAIMILALILGLGWLYILGMIIVEIGYGDWNNYHFIQVNQISKDEFRATTSSIYSLCMKLFGAIALILGGFISSNFGNVFVFVLFFAISCFALIFNSD
jgi:MFS family permease